MNSLQSRNIKAELVLKNITQSEIARSLGMAISSVHDVISGRRANPKIRQAIADAIGKNVTEIWPEEKAA